MGVTVAARARRGPVPGEFDRAGGCWRGGLAGPEGLLAALEAPTAAGATTFAMARLPAARIAAAQLDRLPTAVQIRRAIRATAVAGEIAGVVHQTEPVRPAVSIALAVGWTGLGD